MHVIDFQHKDVVADCRGLRLIKLTTEPIDYGFDLSTARGQYISTVLFLLIHMMINSGKMARAFALARELGPNPQWGELF